MKTKRACPQSATSLPPASSLLLLRVVHLLLCSHKRIFFNTVFSTAILSRVLVSRRLTSVFQGALPRRRSLLRGDGGLRREGVRLSTGGQQLLVRLGIQPPHELCEEHTPQFPRDGLLDARAAVLTRGLMEHCRWFSDRQSLRLAWALHHLAAVLCATRLPLPGWTVALPPSPPSHWRPPRWACAQDACDHSWGTSTTKGLTTTR